MDISKFIGVMKRPFHPNELFSTTDGVWYDPSDMSTMFQDAAGTIPVTAMGQPVGKWLDKSGNGNHATQPITASRPTLGARYNLLTKTELLDDVVWGKYGCTVSATEGPSGNTGAFRITEDTSTTTHYLSQPITVAASKVFTVLVKDDGAGYCVISWRGNRDIRYDAIRYNLTTATKITVKNESGYYLSDTINILSDGWIEITITLSAAGNFIIACANPVKDPSYWVTYAGDGVSGIKVYHPNVNSGLTSKPYQRVNTATDYDTDPTKFPKYLNFDGIDDYLNLPYLGLYANGSTSIIAALDSRTQATNAALVSERNSTVSTQQYIPSRRITNDGIDAYVVNDAGSVVKDTNGTTASLRTKTVRSIVDNGQNINIFKDGILSGYDEYTRAGSLSLDNTTIGASISSTNSMFMSMNLYGLIITKSAIPDTYRRLAENMLARKIGMQVYNPITAIDSIGVPGEAFFGVGRVSRPPSGYTELLGDDNYGNYQYSDGSVQVCVPQFWERYGHIDNPTFAAYGVNSLDIKPKGYFASEAIANAAGYSLNRAFIDGNQHKAVLFIDKYMCSNNGGIASSIKNGNPLSTASDHNQISGLTGAPSNTFAGYWQAAKTRGRQFFVASRFIYAALALLSLAHGQAATSATNCAWYDAAGVTNFPKGCNNSLRDGNDTSVLYTSDGYQSCGKTGSGTPFAKTTHNGQACGVADLNGLMWEISQGVTCIATSKNITGATQTNPVNLTITGHGMTTGKYLQVGYVIGMTQLNDKIYTVTVVDADHVTLNGVDGTAFTPYTSGGSATYGTFYVAKESTRMADFTSGTSLITDHFGITGVTNNMEPFVPYFNTTYPNNGFIQRVGNGTNQVLSPDLVGNNSVLRYLGVPSINGSSPTGDNLFGKDYFYQYIINEICLFSSAIWNSASSAGVWASSWNNARWGSANSVGFRSASYPVSEWGSDDA